MRHGREFEAWDRLAFATAYAASFAGVKKVKIENYHKFLAEQKKSSTVETYKMLLTHPVVLMMVAIEFCSGVLRNGIMHWGTIFSKDIGVNKTDIFFSNCFKKEMVTRAPLKVIETLFVQGTDIRDIEISHLYLQWYWLEQIESANQALPQDVPPRTGEFITGIELQTYYHPTLTPRLPVTFKEIESLQAGWVFLTPTWTFTQQYPPVLGGVSGKDQSWNDLSFSAETARSFGLQVAYQPQANFPLNLDEWWSSSTRDYPWWQVWFERYSHFILSFADKAQLDGAQALVLGGDWISPALPGGILSDGTPSGVPADAERRWRELIAGVRERFEGQLFWALPADIERIQPPPFIEELDHVYLLWSLPLTGSAEYSQEQLVKTAGNYLDDEVFLLDISLEMPITIAASYPSAKGGLQGCVSELDEIGSQTCLDPLLLEPPHPDNTDMMHDFQGQASAYAALMQAINARDWIDGFVSRGFYTPARLQDKSNSIYGKPAAEILSGWYAQWLPAAAEE